MQVRAVNMAGAGDPSPVFLAHTEEGGKAIILYLFLI